MSKFNWLPLAEYSGKYSVSISTLRRKIKKSQIEYSFDEGRYLLKDLPMNDHQPPKGRQKASVRSAPPPKKSKPEVAKKSASPSAPPDPVPPSPPRLDADQELRPATADRLLDELKRAYSIILQEKEEQILQLKGEVADLKTLVRVLEGENERLKGTAGSVSTVKDIDEWLSDT